MTREVLDSALDSRRAERVKKNGWTEKSVVIWIFLNKCHINNSALCIKLLRLSRRKIETKNVKEQVQQWKDQWRNRQIEIDNFSTYTYLTTLYVNLSRPIFLSWVVNFSDLKDLSIFLCLEEDLE